MPEAKLGKCIRAKEKGLLDKYDGLATAAGSETRPRYSHTHTHETGSSLSCRACNAYWQSLQCIMAESTVHSVRVCSADRQSRKSRVADSMVQSARVYNAKPTQFGLAVSTPLIFPENPEVLAPVCNAEWQSFYA